MTADGKQTVDVVTLTTVRTTIVKECPVCGENMVFEKIERQKNGKKVSEKLIKKNKKHSVKGCIREWQYKKLEEANFSEDTEICESCDHYVTDYFCSSEYRYCNHPDYTFHKTEEMIQFQKEFERGEYEMDSKRKYLPFDKCKPYVDDAGRCDRFERPTKKE